MLDWDRLATVKFNASELLSITFGAATNVGDRVCSRKQTSMLGFHVILKYEVQSGSKRTPGTTATFRNAYHCRVTPSSGRETGSQTTFISAFRYLIYEIQLMQFVKFQANIAYFVLIFSIKFFMRNRYGPQCEHIAETRCWSLKEITEWRDTIFTMKVLYRLHFDQSMTGPSNIQKIVKLKEE